ncbi:MAG: 40S ribosomal protein S19, partial [Nanoarchaeota archaeon]
MALHDVPAEQLIAKTAEALKKDIKQPEWATFVKTGHTRERQPTNLDW